MTTLVAKLKHLLPRSQRLSLEARRRRYAPDHTSCSFSLIPIPKHIAVLTVAMLVSSPSVLFSTAFWPNIRPWPQLRDIRKGATVFERSGLEALLVHASVATILKHGRWWRNARYTQLNCDVAAVRAPAGRLR